ncbi:MAG TPA: hypothetical protein V6D17_19175 [Candidatus Obscuribacterales bacterium]
MAEANPGNTSPSPEKGSASGTDPKALRAGFWANLSETAKHIRESMGSESTRLRGSDYVSVISFSVAAVLLVACQFMPNGLSLRPWFVLLLFCALLYFVASHIGVVKSFTARQARIIWIIIVASFISGAVFSLMVFELLRVL